ncbi:MAG TPA: glycosyltransferase family 4 protein [Kineosporiaceae bacterium]|nr:glycosyltransferase family 4 protein [Kineosporiaceae bacterium]
MNRRVAMVVRNAVAGDSRVRKSAAALAGAGWDVTVLGTSPDLDEHRLELDGVPVVLVPVRPGLGPADAVLLADRDVALRGPGRLPWSARRRISRPVGPLRGAARQVAGALTPGGGWRRLDPWVQEVELALAPHVEALEPAVVHAHDHHTVPLAARSTAVLGARGTGTVWVHDAHELSAATADRGARGLRGLLRRRMVAGMLAELVPTAAAVVTVSEELADRLAADLRLAARPTVVLNAPPVAAARPAPSLRQRAGLGPEVPLLVYAGGLARSRGVDLAVRALPRLPGVHLALVAPDDDPQLPALRRLADALGAAQRLHVVPYVAPDQVVEHLRGADAGLVPLRHRPNHEISLVTKYLEYLQAGLPLVVSDVRSMAAFTRAHGLGEVFAVGAGEEPDGAALAAAAARVLADPGRYRAARAAAAATIGQLTWERQAQVLTGLYDRFVPAKPGSAPSRPDRQGPSLR